MKNIILTLLFIVLLGSFGYAQEIEFFVPTTEIYPDDTFSTSLSITLEEPSSREFKIRLLNAKQPIETQANFPDFECEAEETIYGLDLICDISGSQKTNRSFYIEYQNKGLVTKDGSLRLFEQEFSIPYKSENLFIKANLPEGMVLQKDQSYIPEYGEVTSDGRRIVVFWKGSDISAGEAIGLKISYEPLPFSLPLEVLFIIGLAIAVIAVLIMKRKKHPLIMPILKTDEKLVLKGILKYGDGVNQKILVRESGYSKAKVSKVLKSLAERGIIKLERVGRTNKVYINRKIGKNQ